MRTEARPAALLLLAAGAAMAWGGLPARPGLWAGAASLSAWAGAGLLLASLLLMLRSPALARLWGGLDAMYRWHHRAGVLGYVLLLVHGLALAAAAWQRDPAAAWQQLAPWRQPWSVGLGWIALLALMLGLALTFSPRVGYRRWRMLHVLLALGVPLGLGHAAALAGPGRAAALALLLAAISSLAWRLLAGDRGAAASLYEVRAVQAQAEGVIEATLAPLAAPLSAAPGQFVLVRFVSGPNYRACGEFHPFSVSAVAPDGGLRLTIKALGRCSSRLQALQPGVMARLQGPFGAFLQQPRPQPQLWVAGGIGITPFMAALRQQALTQPTTLVYLYRSAGDAAFLEELQSLAAELPLFTLKAVATGAGTPALLPLLAEVPGLSAREVHVCGPAGLVQGLRALLREQGVASENVHHESFDFR